LISNAEIRKAIAECQGDPNPNAYTCIKLAAYYTILNNNEQQLSYASKPVDAVRMNSDSEFFEAIQGVNTKEVLVVMDELMDGVRAMMPRLYDVTMERLKNL
jgi:hypothetical protein